MVNSVGLCGSWEDIYLLHHCWNCLKSIHFHFIAQGRPLKKNVSLGQFCVAFPWLQIIIPTEYANHLDVRTRRNKKRTWRNGTFNPTTRTRKIRWNYSKIFARSFNPVVYPTLWVRTCHWCLNVHIYYGSMVCTEQSLHYRSTVQNLSCISRENFSLLLLSASLSRQEVVHNTSSSLV